MRRLLLLAIVTVVCWGAAMACSGGGVPQSPGAGSGSGGIGGVNPLPPGGGGGTGGGEGVPVPVPELTATIDGQPVVQDGVYAATELKAHASDAKGQATTFHWSLTGIGIDGGQFADGPDAAFKLPSVTDKSAYELTAIGSLGGKAVHQTIHFFTVPKPTATIKANVNQAAGLPVFLADGGAVLKGQKVQFSADAKFADLFKWKIVKNNGAATDLGQAPAVEFAAGEVASYKVLLMAFGPGGNTGPQPLEFKFDVKNNAVAITVISQVTKALDFAQFLKPAGQYPLGSAVVIDASGIGEALGSMQCTVTDSAKAAVKPVEQSATQYKFSPVTAGDYLLNCAYALKEGYEPLQGEQLETVVGFKILPKAEAAIWVDGKVCDPATPLVFEVGKTVLLSANGSSGNISSYSWFSSSGGVAEPTAPNTNLVLKNVMGYPITLNVKGIGDSASSSCTVYAQPKPNAVVAADSTVKDGRSYILGSAQRAHATVTQGVADTFDWSLTTAAGTTLVQKSLQTASDAFDFILGETGALTLQVTSKLMTLAGASNSIALNSKSGQVSLITPLDFSNIQSIAAVSDTDVYFASPSAIFHKGVDGRVVQVKNIAFAGDVHPAQPNGFFARNAGDIYLLTTDGGYWRYQFKKGWAFTPMTLGANVYGLAATGSPAGSVLYVAASNTRLFEVTADTGAAKMIGGGSPAVVTMQGGTVIAAAATGKVADPMVMKCAASTCTKLTWAAGSAPAVDVSWRAVGTGASGVYLSAASGRIYTIQNDQVAMVASLKSDDYIAAFSDTGSVLFAIGNKGGVYRITTNGMTLNYTTTSVVATAGGAGATFWARDGVTGVVAQISNANPVALAAQKAIGTVDAGCADQKQVGMVGETAYVSVCTVPAGKPPLYTIWSVPYFGDLTPNGSLANATPVVGVTSDGAGGILVMRSDGANTNFIQQQKADGTVVALNLQTGPGEFYTGMSGKFFVTNQGIIVNDGKNYPQVKVLADAHHPFAVGDVLYLSYKSDARLAKFDLKSSTLVDMANVDPKDPVDPGPIVDIGVDVDGRLYVLTPKALYRYDDIPILTKLYEDPGSLLNSMANMNGRHMLVTRTSKGAVLVQLDQPAGPVELFPNMEVGAGVETWGVGYNGTEFLLSGRNLLTNALLLYQFGAPQ